MRTRSTVRGLAVVALATTIAGCLRQYVPAKPGSVLDSTCEGPTTAGADWVAWEVPSVAFRAPPAWRMVDRQPTELRLRRVDAELNVWTGPRWVFPQVEPWQSVRCTIARGDTTITAQTSRVAGRLLYRVDVTVQPLIEGRHVYLQLQTPYVEHLRDMRAILESIRFAPGDTAGIAKRRGQT